MKYILLVITALFFLSGCAEPSKQIETENLPGVESVTENNSHIYTFHGSLKIRGANAIFGEGKPSETLKNAMKPVFYSIAKFGLSKNYRYMAVVNDRFNNLSGYPVNSWKALESYMKLYGTKHYRPSITDKGGIESHGRASVKVVYFKKRPKGLFLWDLKQLERDTQQ